jgi:hypothetical protein
MPHLVVSISGHGFGHVAQTAPVLNQLHRLLPELRITLRSAVPLAHLQSRIIAPFEHLPSEGDIGMLMSSAIDVLADESRAAYRDFHRNWAARVADETALLRDLRADLVLSNVGYLPLAGAQHAGISNAALCSLNWFDIYRHYCGEDGISAVMREAYAGADIFFRATPGMAMNEFTNVAPIAPVADVGRNRRDELNRTLGLSHAEILVLVSLGGIASRLPMERWPHIDGVRWLVQKSWQVDRPDAITLESLPFSFGDLLASCDVLLTKPGYGSFVEATANGVPVLYVSRADWPESTALTAWLQAHGNASEISREQLDRGALTEPLQDLLTRKRRVLQPTGAAEVAGWLATRLSASRH